MTAIPAPTIILPKEEWADADFDLPDGDIHASDAESDKEDEDWDMEMDLGKTGGTKAQLVLQGIANRAGPSKNTSRMFTIRPPPAPSADEDDDDEGVSTIKVAVLPKPVTKPPPPSPIDEDFEDGFALPSDLTTLSLRPLSLSHRTSKSSLEWGDKDQTSSSSQSSDAYSTFGFADHSPSSNYTSASLPETETEEDEEVEDILDGLDVPTGLFESGHGAKKLGKILELKKHTTFCDDRVKVVSPDPEDDFEIGLVIDNDDLSPSRLLQNAKSVLRSTASSRSKSAPARPPAALRPPSRMKNERAKSPNNPPISSMLQLRRITAPPASPPPKPAQPVRSQTYSQAVQAIPSPSPSSLSFLSAKPGSLRVQKSHSGLKPASPPQSRKLSRKASLPSLSESNQAQASGSGSGSGASGNVPVARYETPTASSRAKVHATLGRLHGLEYHVPPTRPSTPSSNPAALRLTMPTSSSRVRSRAPITNVFPPIPPPLPTAPLTRSTSPLPHARPPSRPPSAASSSASIRSKHAPSSSLPSAPKVLKKPKRQRTYGDGTELDGFDDLPTDREKEGQYRVQPKGYGNRIPGASYPKHDPPATPATGTIRRKGKRDFSGSGSESIKASGPSKTLKRTARIEFPSKPPEPTKPERTKDAEASAKKKKVASPGHARRKPTLIRNLGGAGAAKVVGEMKWNPGTLRWEGNDQALRDFDAAVGTSTRPALITHLTGSSIGSPGGGSFASGARVVGNMIFDPQRMCWISTLPPDEEEPDVFADLADDEDDDDWEARGGTIRASQQLQTGTSDKSSTSVISRTDAPSPSRSHTRNRSESESDRCSRASMVCDVDDSFVEKCRAAEERHRAELRHWLSTQDVHAEPDRSHLFEIRALATRQY